MDIKFPMILHQTAIAWRNLLDTRLKPLGLSQAKWRVLLHLSVSDVPLSQIELAQRLGIEGASVVGLIDRLAKEGWVVRKPSLKDRRIKTLSLTTKANRTIHKIKLVANALSQDLLNNIPITHLEQSISVLNAIKDKIDTYK